MIFAVLPTKIETATTITAVWFAAANISEAAIYLFIAPRKIAHCGNSVPYVAIPVTVES
jgi:hypothetical protein